MLRMPPEWRTCHTPSKVKFFTEEDAHTHISRMTELAELRRVRRHPNAGRMQVNAIRPYLCVCGFWHTTSQPVRVDTHMGRGYRQFSQERPHRKDRER